MFILSKFYNGINHCPVPATIYQRDRNYIFEFYFYYFFFEILNFILFYFFLNKFIKYKKRKYEKMNQMRESPAEVRSIGLDSLWDGQRCG